MTPSAPPPAPLASPGAGHILSGLADVVDRYDAFLVDSYGVLHDGRTLFTETAGTLSALRALGRKVVVLTNTPRRAAVVADEIAAVGIGAQLYDFIVSAGELTYRRLADPAPLGIATGARYFYIGPERSRALLDSLPLAPVQRLAEADLLIILGLYSGRESLADYQALLAEAHARGLPAICGNPDRSAIRSGRSGLAAGAIANAYAERGGDVRYFGKPFPDIYSMTLAALPGIAPERVLAVGDGLFTDIAGANAAGLDAAFVANGVHGAELDPLDPLDPGQLASLFARERVHPRYTLPSFRMGG